MSLFCVTVFTFLEEAIAPIFPERTNYLKTTTLRGSTMTDGQDTNTTPEPKGWRKKLQFGVSRFEVGLSVLFGIFFFGVFVYVFVKPEKLEWITWLDALQTYLLFWILATASSLHIKLIESKKDR